MNMKGRKQSWVTKIFLLLTLPYLVTVFVNGPEAVSVNKTTDMENILPIILRGADFTGAPDRNNRGTGSHSKE